jgi:hypothetical protein
VSSKKKKTDKTTTLVKQWRIPLYGCVFTFILFKDEKSIDNKLINTSIKAEGWEWGDAGCLGFHVCNPKVARFCIAMLKDGRGVSIDTLTHEIFHLTHRIIEWANGNFDADHHEHAALLNGYFNDKLFRILYENKIPLTFESR